MSDFAKQYTVMEVKKLMLASEGSGPGRHGGHAMGEHGYLREDVTDRGKSKDGAFRTGWSFNYKKTSDLEDSVMSSLFDDYVAPDVRTMQFSKSSDQFVAVCSALNSDKGQTKLKELDALPDTGTHEKAFQAPTSVGHLVTKVRTGSGSTESEDSFSGKMHVILYKLEGKLHLHTAYAV